MSFTSLHTVLQSHAFTAGLKVKINTNSEKQPEIGKNIVSVCNSVLASQLLLDTVFILLKPGGYILFLFTFLACERFRVVGVILRKRRYLHLEP